ncbi:WecB/TagA/CpsF family glycosyltransferase [Priestia filamentosa]|uniref:WecB/TagA/CpsF family glycosyltransferase n=1 Tax=Priestia filamentosa TaxID=1402861 RepID=UPI00397E7633
MSDIMGIQFTDDTLKQTAHKLSTIIDENYVKLHHVITANPEIALRIIENEEFKNIATHADIITPDGIGIVYASKMLGRRIKERVTGFDLVVEIFKTRKQKSKSLKVYALGAQPDTIKKAVNHIENTYPNVTVIGFRDGYYKKEEEAKIVKEINECKPDLLLVGLGSPKQEEFIFRHKAYLNTKVAIGVGGVLDVLSGNVKRAPEFYQKIGMEWFYRLVTNPRRLKRQLSLFKFGFKVLGVALGIVKKPS